MISRRLDKDVRLNENTTLVKGKVNDALRHLHTESGRAASAQTAKSEQLIYTYTVSGYSDRTLARRVLSKCPLYKLILLILLPASSLSARFMSVEALRGLSNNNSAVTVFELAARQDSLAPRGRVILKTDLGAK